MKDISNYLIPEKIYFVQAGFKVEEEEVLVEELEGRQVKLEVELQVLLYQVNFWPECDILVSKLLGVENFPVFLV